MGYLTLAIALIYSIAMCLLWGSITSKLHRIFALMLLSDLIIGSSFLVKIIREPSSEGEQMAALFGLIIGFVVVVFCIIGHVSEAARLQRAYPQKQLAVTFSLPKTKRCNACNKRNEIGSNFCSNCGASLSEKSSAGRDTKKF